MNFWLRILDDNIESASQVSGPRPIAPYDPPTSRSALNQIDSERFQTTFSWLAQYYVFFIYDFNLQKRDLPKEAGVLAWVMSRQRLDEKEANSRNQVNIVGMHLKISNI